MGTLSYGMITSLDGYVKGPDGGFDWAEPDEPTHRFANERERDFGTFLYGRRMFETMRVWAEDDWLDGEPAVVREYAEIWRGRDKVVFSTTLEPPTLTRTTLRRSLDPSDVRALKDSTDQALSVAGPTLAVQLLRAGLVDELVLYVAPVVVGSGSPALPDVSLDLRLLEERRIGSRFVYLRYAIRNSENSPLGTL